MTPELLAKLIPWIPALGALICAGLGTQKSLRHLAGWACVASVAASALCAGLLAFGPAGLSAAAGTPVHVFDWMTVGGLQGGMDYWIDPLACVMLLVVTGIGSLIALYAVGYMKGDKHAGRFFSAVALFIFAMTTLVMAKNLLVLFLGWEGVGFCSYLLIGYYYEKGFAVAAGKKAFIVNRIGDLGFLIGIFLCWQVFGTIDIQEILVQLHGAEACMALTLIPFCLMVAAFGKSAQFPLYVWLPDAMAGPTPVSALVHAATMVTSGVYLIVRLYPLFQQIDGGLALTVIAIVGCFTALLAATIALCNNDLKGVFAYSTVSQLGYMFLGLGAGHPEASVFHLVTHAFFKALLFLAAGSVMHALAGQLDIRTMGGLRKKMPLTAALMFVGCLALAGFPFLSGFFSKDAILAGVLENPNPLFKVLFGVALGTAFLTAFYTFRLWCTVFLGETKFQMGHDHHADHHADDAHGHDAHDAHGAHEPHEMPFFPMNLPLILLAAGSIAVGFLLQYTWPIEGLVKTAAGIGSAHEVHAEHALSHNALMAISGAVALAGIGLAFFTHAFNRAFAAKVAASAAPLVRVLEGKWFVDEFFAWTLVKPLWFLGRVLYIVDTLIIDTSIRSLASLPALGGALAREGQRGRLQGHGLAMLTGVAVVAVFLLFAFYGAR